MFISVVLCTYNGEKFLQEQLDSLANQTRLPDELVVGDDRSSDQTILMLEKFSRTAPFPVKIIINEQNLGYRDNFLHTARNSSGKYIAFSDQDDVWLPEKLDRCLDILEQNGLLLASHAFNTVDSDLNHIAHFGPPADVTCTRGQFANRNTLGFTQVFRRELLTAFDIDNRPADPNKFSTKMAHDQWISFLADAMGSTHLIARTLALYRQHGNNLYGRRADSPNIKNALAAFNYSIASGYEYRSTMSAINLHRSQILSQISNVELFTPEQIENARLSAEYWARCARDESLRASVFSSTRLQHRVDAWGHAIIGGAYSQSGLKGMRALVKDLLGGVLFPSTAPHYLRHQPPTETS